jgi:hypothetical protein
MEAAQLGNPLLAPIFRIERRIRILMNHLYIRIQSFSDIIIAKRTIASHLLQYLFPALYWLLPKITLEHNRSQKFLQTGGR